MILSKYCKIYPDREDADSLLLFSTIKASIITVPRSMIADIEKDNLSEEEKETLVELGFIVKDWNEEKLKMLDLMNRLNTINKKFEAVLVMNLDCNLACKYCFEGQRKGKFYMTPETADAFVEFVEGRTKEGGLEQISVTFYGGEPLLSKELIIYTAKKLKALAESNGIEFSFSFITNGTLLTLDTVNKLKTYGLKSALFTLDGHRDVHNEFRPFKNGKGSFDTIFRNMQEICGLVDIQLGGNFTKENYMEFPRLLDYFTEMGFTPEKVSAIKFDPVSKESDGIAPPDFHDGCETINEPWIIEASIFLREEILRRGYRTSKVTPIACMIENKHKMVVNYNGDIYKCPGLIGREGLKVGHISSGIMNYKQSHNLDNWKNERCLDCEYLPLCFGGCRYMKLVRDGNMNGVDCKKPYFDAVLEQLVLQDIKYGVKAE